MESAFKGAIKTSFRCIEKSSSRNDRVCKSCPFPGGALNFGLRAMCHQKDPPFFRSLSLKDPHFYQLSPNDLLFLTKSLSPKDPDTSLSLKDPSFLNLIVKQVTIF